jgi:hypothetical protein
VLAIIRSAGEEKEYLEWWLQTFAGPEWHEPSRCCPLFPHLLAPRNACELDMLETQIEPTLRILSTKARTRSES